MTAVATGAGSDAAHNVGAAGRPPGRATRQRRAAIAARLLAASPAAAAALDWDLLDAAPDWLAWPEAVVTRLQQRVGACAQAASLRLWIDAPRLAAARDAVGAAYLDALLALPAPALPSAVDAGAAIDSAARVAPVLRATGASVLLAALPHGALRRAVEALTAPVHASDMAVPLAESLLAHALALAARAGGPA